MKDSRKRFQAVEKSRSWATSDDIRQQILAESIGVYEKAIQASVNSNQLEKAIEYCDRTRAQRLVDLMHSNDLYASGEIPPAVQKYLQEFEAKQREIDAEVEQLRKPSQGNKELADVGSQSRSRADLSAYTEKIQELEGEKQRNLGKYSQFRSGFSGTSSSRSDAVCGDAATH